jgi:hypothetical protein
MRLVARFRRILDVLMYQVHLKDSRTGNARMMRLKSKQALQNNTKSTFAHSNSIPLVIILTLYTATTTALLRWGILADTLNFIKEGFFVNNTIGWSTTTFHFHRRILCFEIIQKIVDRIIFLNYGRNSHDCLTR